MRLSTALVSLTLLGQPAFEVASVREHRGNVIRSGPLTVSSPFVRLQGYTLFALVMDAYHLRDFQLDFGKARAEDVADTMYDISARAPGDGVPRLEDVRAMLQQLLAERFKLQTHLESRERKVYTLVVAGKSGPRRTPASAGSGACTVRSSLANDKRNNDETFINCPMERLADRLTNLMFEPVIDETGLSGAYDFRLVAVPEYRTRRGVEPVDISPITAVTELGLKLVAKKAPVDTLVIDHFEKPAAN